jgi:DNA primase
MTFSQDFIDKVRDANNIVDLFSEYTQLKRSGSRLTGLCPFPGHNEKTPSFSVSEDKQLYHCFGCKRAGQIFTALQELKGLNFPEAIEYLANRAGIILPVESQRTKADIAAKSHRENLLKINSYAAKVFHHHLTKIPKDHYVKLYCEKRGLSAEIINTFQIGFALNEWESLATQLRNAKVALQDAGELGLVRQRKEGDGFFDLFRDRLIFPIYSHKSECVGFGGRSLTDEQMPKYLNSPESELFSKGKIFYGLNETAKYIRTEGSAIVVEGYMDFLALYAAGIKNVVATLGTALTPNHAKLLKRYTQNVVVLFDGDEAGQSAATRSLPILLEEELLPKAIFLPDELDPDEFIKEHGTKALVERIRSAEDLFTVVLNRLLVGYRATAAEKVLLLDRVTPYLAATKDARLKDLYITEIAQKLSVEAAWVAKHVGSDANRAKVAENRPSVTPEMPKDVIGMGPKINLKGASQAELFLLNISLMSAKKYEHVLTTGVVQEVQHKGVREMFAKSEGYYRQMPNEFAKLSATLMALTDTPNLLGLQLGEPLCSMSEEALDKLLADCIRQVKERDLRKQTRELSASLRGSSTESERLEKLEQIMNIQKSKHTLRRERES